MWLINTETLELERFTTCPENAYAILSHTWGPDMEESSFEEFRAGKGQQKIGYRKIKAFCARALDKGLSHAWVDTCCINKDSSTELSEAINSMFNWYKNAKVCYAVLEDVNSLDCAPGSILPQSFPDSRWFTRGWTLQELIAPKELLFWDQTWVLIGARADFATDLRSITGIAEDVLLGQKLFLDCSIAQRMSWAAHRQTTRIEDTAYCLIGLFEANISLQYGEGSKAFLRLQQEIMRQSDDETIFAWTDVADEGSGLLAPSPANFREAGGIEVNRSTRERLQCSETNRGLRLDAQLLPCEMNTYIMPLRCSRLRSNRVRNQLAIFLCRTSDDQIHRRVKSQGQSTYESSKLDLSDALETVISVPHNGRSLILAPHGGFVNIKIMTNMRPFRLSPPRTRTGLLNFRFTKWNILWDTENAMDSAIASRNTSSSDLAELCIRSTASELMEGLHIALTRPSDVVPYCRYILQIGFDLEFNPISRIWKLSRINQQTIRNRSPRIWWYHALASLRTACSWSDSDEPRSKFVEVDRLTRSALESAVLWFESSKPIASTTGDRRSGYSIQLDSTQLRCYECRKVDMSCTHSDDLSWQIVFQEKATHQHMWLSSIYCPKQRYRSGTKWVRDTIKMLNYRFVRCVFTAILFFWLDCFPVTLLGATFSNKLEHLSMWQTAGYVFFFVNWPILLVYVFWRLWRTKTSLSTTRG